MVVACLLVLLAGCSSESCSSTPPVSYVDISGAMSTSSLPAATNLQTVGVHRAVNPSTGAHFYTTDPPGANSRGFQAEALDYFYLWTAPSAGFQPLFRCLKPNGKHFYTTSDDCEGSGATREGALGFIAVSPAPGLTPLHRLYNGSNGDHLYTVRALEKSRALEQRYADEGVVGYVWVPPFYIAPVSETADPAVLTDMKNTFDVAPGIGNIVLGWSKSTWYLKEVRDATQDYVYDPTTLRQTFELAVSFRLPLVINMNGGRWSERSPLVEYLRTYSELGHPLVTLDQRYRPLFSYDFGQQYFSLSRLNRPYYKYKKRNLQSAAAEVAAFWRLHPELFVGVSLDSETLLSDKRSRYGDYNPLAIEEWRQWLSGTGIYDPVTGEYAGEARSPVFTSIDEFNAAMKTAFGSWSEVQPPRSWNENPTLWQEWRIWGITMVAHHTQDMADWIESQGIPRDHIFNHQTPGMAPMLYGDDLSTAFLFNGETAGITAYKCSAGNAELIRYLRSRARRVGAFEWNPQGDAESQYRSLELLYEHTVRVVAPYHWPVDHNFPRYSIKGSPTEVALRNFIRNNAGPWP